MKRGLIIAGVTAAVGASVMVLAPHAPGEPMETAPTRTRLRLERWGQGLPRAGQWRHGFAVVDFDGDGHLDVVHGPARKSSSRTPQIFLGDGAGTFRQTTRFAFPPLPYDYGDVACADFDGDGALDLAVASHLVGLAVLVRRGDAFEPYGPPLGLVEPSVLGPFSSRAIEPIDWDGDGRLDLVTSSDGPRPFQALPGNPPARGGIAILRGIEGGFEPLWPPASVGHGDSIAIGDFDPAPGIELLAAINVVGSSSVVYRHGANGPEQGALAGLPADRVVRSVALAQTSQGSLALIGGLAMGSSGLEGSLDAIATRDPSSSQRLFVGQPLRAVAAIGVGDLDDDGHSEIVAGDEDGTLRVYVQDDDRWTERTVHVPEERLIGCTAFAIVLLDLDGRPGDEIVASYAGDDGACPSSGGIEAYRAVSE